MESKPGLQTTEFWTMIFGTILQFLNLTGLWDFVPNSWSVFALAVIGGLYSAGRGLAKLGQPYNPPPSE